MFMDKSSSVRSIWQFKYDIFGCILVVRDVSIFPMGLGLIGIAKCRVRRMANTWNQLSITIARDTQRLEDSTSIL